MATQKQIEANRLNAQKSTGPRTEEGKKAVAGNRLKHGLRASDAIVLRIESREEFDRLQQGLMEHYGADGPMEQALVRRIAAAQWRLRRAVAIETELMDEQMADISVGLLGHCKREGRPLPPALAAWQAAPDTPFAPGVTLSRSVVPKFTDGTFDRLRRYETAIERSMYQAIRELERVRGLSAGKTSNAGIPACDSRGIPMGTEAGRQARPQESVPACDAPAVPAADSSSERKPQAGMPELQHAAATSSAGIPACVPADQAEASAKPADAPAPAKARRDVVLNDALAERIALTAQSEMVSEFSAKLEDLVAGGAMKIHDFDAVADALSGIGRRPGGNGHKPILELIGVRG